MFSFFISTLITSIDNDEDRMERLTEEDLVAIISWLSEGWNEISSLSLVRSCKMLLEQMPGCDSADQEDIADLSLIHI